MTSQKVFGLQPFSLQKLSNELAYLLNSEFFPIFASEMIFNHITCITKSII